MRLWWSKVTFILPIAHITGSTFPSISGHFSELWLQDICRRCSSVDPSPFCVYGSQLSYSQSHAVDCTQHPAHGFPPWWDKTHLVFKNQSNPWPAGESFASWSVNQDMGSEWNTGVHKEKEEGPLHQERPGPQEKWEKTTRYCMLRRARPVMKMLPAQENTGFKTHNFFHTQDSACASPRSMKRRWRFSSIYFRKWVTQRVCLFGSRASGAPITPRWFSSFKNTMSVSKNPRQPFLLISRFTAWVLGHLITRSAGGGGCTVILFWGVFLPRSFYKGGCCRHFTPS